MLPKRLYCLVLVPCLAVAACSTTPSPSGSYVVEPGKADAKKELILNNLLTSKLESVEDTEVVLSHVTIPADTSLPKHWHPGEEFAYVLEGSVTLWQEGKPDVQLKAGDVGKVPLRQIHTATTGDEGVTLLVFRVHKEGQPERILTD